jgi:hypothetical protein
MSSDQNDIYTIVERLRILEEGLDKDQRSVNQLSATFRPKTVAVLTAKTDPKNPMAGKLVGGAESVESDDPMLEADMAEDVLAKVKSSFKDFIRQAEQSIDKEVQQKTSGDTDLKAKSKKDRGLRAKDQPATPVPEDQEDLPSDLEHDSQTESAAVKTVMNEYGVYEMHGNERDGFEIRSAGRSMPTRFINLAEAELAIEMFQARQRKRELSQDYLDEE